MTTKVKSEPLDSNATAWLSDTPAVDPSTLNPKSEAEIMADYYMDDSSDISSLDLDLSPPPAIKPESTSPPPRTRDPHAENSHSDSRASSSLSSLEDTPSPPAQGVTLEWQAVKPEPQSPPPQQSPPQHHNPSPRLRRQKKSFKIECTHTTLCSCAMHAAHPSFRAKHGMPAPGGKEKGRYPHLSEWALGVMVWPESGVRSTIGKGWGVSEEGGGGEGC